MKTKFSGILTLLLAFVVQLTFAQEKTISGTVSDASGLPLPGATVLVKGTTTGTSTDFDGKYSISASQGSTLVFSFVGYTTKEVAVGSSNTINITMSEDAALLDEVVVTALGISREKKSLGYSSQEIGGDAVSTVKTDNVVGSLSGKVSGIQIRTNNNFGGGANFLIRGASSLFGSNQPLFVVDGIQISNNINNSAAQRGGSTGYDYGNTASDINPDDVESINVLKGAAAAALYGSQAANGVVIITTKKGKANRAAKITVSSGITVGSIDKKTFVEYQNEYGAGYGPYYGSTGYFEDYDVNGDGIDDLEVPLYDDASYGAAFDPNLLVYQWDAFVPESQYYGQARPYVAAKHTPVDFFETSYQYNNSVSIAGGGDKSTYRIGYTNFETTGILPNSKLNKNIVNLSGTLAATDRLKVGSNANVVIQRTIGRNSTGYSDNLMSTFRQWWQVNNDIYEQRDIFHRTGKNYTWNSLAGAGGGGPTDPLYWDNPYWTRYKNFESDGRTRFYGNVFATYSLTDWLDVTAKASIDTYTELREERRAVGSVGAPFGVLRDTETSGYDRTDIVNTDMLYDLMFNVNTNITEDLNLSGVAGINIRREKYSFYHASTAGGLKIPGLYAISNSANPTPFPVETLSEKQVNGLYAQASLGYKNFLYLDLTDRYDTSSALPSDNNSYNYYGASSSFVFSSIMDADWLTFGKLRAGYAEVGNDLAANNVYDTFTVLNNFGNAALFSYPGTKQNSELKPERTKEIELGLETRFLKDRVGLDLTWYKKNTTNQLMPVQTTTATGFSFKWVNAGEIENKGVEVGLHLVPLKTNDFNWSMDVNWAKNKNKVVSLYGDVKNLQLNSYQGGVSLNATLGQPYGTLRGTGYVYYDKNGNGVTDASEKTLDNRIITSSGYIAAQADQVIGNANPDWNGGVNNTFKYKNLSLSFLIDVQHGGDVFSLDAYYGQGTGVINYTAGLNELGNPVRDPVADGGGVLNVGVQADGTPNTVRARADYYGGNYYWGNGTRNPAQREVYDASYVKLRELSLKYDLPTKWFNDQISKLSLSLVGRNLWIIHKNVPFADPESGLGAGNAQGYLSGSYPTVRTLGLTLNMEF